MGVTERKPAGTSFTSWIDQQIEEAAKRGAFDDLPGAGKPLPARGDEDAGQAWLRDYVRREGMAAEELLPAPLRLRKEAELAHLRAGGGCGRDGLQMAGGSARGAGGRAGR